MVRAIGEEVKKGKINSSLAWNLDPETGSPVH